MTEVRDWAELASEGLSKAFLAIGETLANGWFRSDGGVFAGVSGSSLPTLNGVWATGDAPDPAVVDHLLDLIAADGVPHCLQLRPAAANLQALARRRDMVAAGEIPMMVLV